MAVAQAAVIKVKAAIKSLIGPGRLLKILTTAEIAFTNGVIAAPITLANAPVSTSMEPPSSSRVVFRPSTFFLASAVAPLLLRIAPNMLVMSSSLWLTKARNLVAPCSPKSAVASSICSPADSSLMDCFNALSVWSIGFRVPSVFVTSAPRIFIAVANFS